MSYIRVPSNTCQLLAESKVARSSAYANVLAIVGSRLSMQILNGSGSNSNPCRTLFLKCRNLLSFPESVVKVKLRLRTSSVLIEIMWLSGSRRRRLPLRPRCHLVLQTAGD